MSFVRFLRSFRRKGDLNRHYKLDSNLNFVPVKHEVWYKKYRGIIIPSIGWISFMGLAYWNMDFLDAAKPKKKDEDFSRELKLTSRERHFIRFASVEYDGQIYMTPQDFLESFIEEEPRPRLSRYSILDSDLEKIRKYTPSLKKGSSQMFRSLRDVGIISFTEYLFLLSVLTKPQAGFRIAFNMFDTDDNQRVDIDEFLVILHLLSDDVKAQSAISVEMKRAMEKIFSDAWEDKHGPKSSQQLVPDDATQTAMLKEMRGLQIKKKLNTTLLLHFFGERGNNTLRYDDFRRFMENLQTEVLEMEFQEFARGGNAISEIDFARLLLRYTRLDTKVCDVYLDRLLDRLKESKEIQPGITFEEFYVFCQFLNNLEDFTIAMRMYTLADHPISKDEFHRAVQICTGTTLSAHLVSTVFAIFDEDGDGELSYREFIAIMKDRLHRGFKSHTKSIGWEGFKQCVKQEMKSPVARY